MINPLLARNTKSILLKVDLLIKQKKYSGAFNLLNEFDKENKIPEVLVKKVDLSLLYFAKSKMHRFFVFVDLKHGEKLEEYREKEWKYDLIEFKIDEILKQSIETNPQKVELYRTLGDYYFDIQKRYGNKWLVDRIILLDLAEKNYLKTLELKSSNYKELDKLGVLMIVKKNYKKALDYLEKSIEENSKYAKSYYNIAFAYYKVKQYKTALPYAKKAYQLFKDKNYKFDSAYLIAGLYVLLKENNKAIKYYKYANMVKSDYESLKSILILYLKDHELKNAHKFAEKIFNYDKTKLKNSQDILFIYGEMGYKKELLTVFDKLEKKFKNDNVILGNICFNRAFFYSYFLKNSKLKKENLVKAREYYKKVFPKNHKVFPIIKKELKNNNK